MQNNFDFAKHYTYFQEYAYERDPEYIAEYIVAKSNNLKFLFYGDGVHTVEVISFLKDTSFILGIVTNAKKNDGYVAENFNFNVYQIDQIQAINYDKIILLGYWSEAKIIEFCKNFGVERSSVWAVYTDKEIVERSQKLLTLKIQKIIKNFKTDNTKPSLCLILQSDYRDFVTMSSDEVFKKFSLTKVYLQSNSAVADENEYFDNIVICDNNLNLLIELLKRQSFDLIVFQNMSQADNALFLGLKYLLPKSSKVVTCSYDHILNGFTDFTTQELANIFTHGDIDFLKLNQASEAELLSTSDGYVVNSFGKYFDELVSSKNTNAISSLCCLPNSKFLIDSPKNTPLIETNYIELAYAGSTPQPGHINKQNDVLPYFLGMLNANKNIRMNVLSSWRNKATLEKTVLHNRLAFHDYAPHVEVPKRIQNFHFGFLGVNLNEGIGAYKKIYEAQMNSKLIVYLAAGLPMIVQEPFSFMCEFIQRRQIGIVIKNADIISLEQILLSYDYSLLLQNIRKFQRDFLRQNHPRQFAEYLENITFKVR